MCMINQNGPDIQGDNSFSFFGLENLQMSKWITLNMDEDQIPQEDPLAKTSLSLEGTGGAWWMLGSGAGSVSVQVRDSVADSKSLMAQGTDRT